MYYFFVIFVLNYILISLYKSVGASIATVVSELIVVIAQLYVIRKDIKTIEIIRTSYTYVLASTVMLGTTLIAKAILGIGLKSIIIQVITGIIVYVLMLWILKDEFLELFIDKGKAIIGRKK